MMQQLTAVWTFRYFWLSLVKMDLVTRYRRSFLGVGWSLLMPLAMTAVFCLVFSQFNSDKNDPNAWRKYAQNTLAAMAVWEFLKNSLVQGCKAFLQNEAYIRLSPLPYGIYPLRTVMGNVIHMLITLGVLIAVVAVLGNAYVQPTIWAVVPAILMAMLFGWGIATIAAFATTYFHDISHLIEVGAQAFFFLTPIIYGRELLDGKGLAWFVDVNPIYVFIELVREPMVSGVLPGWDRYAYAGGLTAASVTLALMTISWLQKRVIFQL
jgi:lipopolysaccharide transport system permease protein